MLVIGRQEARDLRAVPTAIRVEVARQNNIPVEIPVPEPFEATPIVMPPGEIEPLEPARVEPPPLPAPAVERIVIEVPESIREQLAANAEMVVAAVQSLIGTHKELTESVQNIGSSEEISSLNFTLRKMASTHSKMAEALQAIATRAPSEWQFDIQRGNDGSLVGARGRELPPVNKVPEV